MQDYKQKKKSTSIAKLLWNPQKSKSSSSDDFSFSDRSSSSDKKCLNDKERKSHHEITSSLSNERLDRSDSSLEAINYSNLPFSTKEAKEYIHIIMNEYNSGKFKKCIETSSVIIYTNPKNGHQVFALKNQTNVTTFYFLDQASLFDEGGQSKLYFAYNLITFEKVAAKMSIPRSHLPDFVNEAKIFKILQLSDGTPYGDCSFFIKNPGSDFPSEKRILFMEYYEGENLKKNTYIINYKLDKNGKGFFSEKKEFPMLVKLKKIKGCLEQVNKLHEKNLLHRDIKLENFQCDDSNPNDPILRIFDFGLTILATEKKRDLVSTPGYRAPEMRELFYTLQSDLFSLGIVVAEILTRCNFQNEIVKLQEKIAESIFLREIFPEEIYNFMPDVFLLESSRNSKLHKDMSEQELDDFIFRKLQIIAISLSQIKPEKRLENSSLREEIIQIDKLLQYIENRKLYIEKKEFLGNLKIELEKTLHHIEKVDLELDQSGKSKTGKWREYWALAQTQTAQLECSNIIEAELKILEQMMDKLEFELNPNLPTSTLQKSLNTNLVKDRSIDTKKNKINDCSLVGNNKNSMFAIPINNVDKIRLKDVEPLEKATVTF